MDSGKRTFYLGRYNCIEQLGTGPIGETYRAKIYGVAGFEKQFAVKRLHPQLSEDEPFVGRFVQAASAFASLDHPGIARVHEVNAQGAHYYIVVDLVRGLDLRRLLDLLQQRGEALAPDAAMTIANDIAEVLEHAHGRTNVLPGGVLHLGLTAQSVMVTYEGEVKLVDVGLLAALVRPGWSENDALTPTLAYLAPEQWRGEEELDARADVFSLGVVLHELIGGSRVFFSDRADELRRAIESGPPAPPPGDPRLQQIVTRALHPDRTQRFANVAEMRAAIQAILGGRVERARTDLSALVRRLAAPRERRTGAFAAVTLPPATPGMSTPVSAAKPPPIPAGPPQPWAPPTPKPPIGPVLSTVPTFNTLAGIGPDDQALVPIELVELPGKPTEKGMQTVHPEDAETNRRPRIPLQELAVGPPPPAPPAASVTETMTAAPSPPPPPEHALPPSSGSTAAASPGMAGTNGEVSKSEAESSWSPPPLTPPPPSPEPAFAKHNAERPEPVEPALSTVPGATLPPRRAGSRAVLGIVVLLAAAGGLAIYFGLSGSVRTAGEAESANRATSPGGNAAGETTVAQELPSHAQEPKEAAQAAPRKTATPAAPGPTPPAAPPPTATGPGASPTTASPTTAPSPTPTPAAPPVVANPRPAPSPSAPATPSATPSSAPPIAGAFEIISTPPGAALFVDGEPQGVTPAQLPLTPGAHKLVVAGEGQMLLKRDVEVKPGARLELTLDPAKLPAAVAGSAGLKVRCKSHGEVRIFVDGADSGRGCPNDERIAVAPGPHKIGLYSVRTGEMHEVEHEVTEGDHSTRVYVKY